MEAQQTHEFVQLNEDEFDKQYPSMDVPGGDEGEVTWEFPEVKKAVEAGTIAVEQVWSLVDGDDGNAYALPGFHVVNVYGYCVTKNPWPHENIEAEWIVYESEENGNG